MREAGFNERAAEAARREADEATARFFRDFAATAEAFRRELGEGGSKPKGRHMPCPGCAECGYEPDEIGGYEGVGAENEGA